MAKFVFDDKELKKKRYDFLDADRGALDGADIGSEKKIVVKNEQGDTTEITFRVTRNVHLGTRQHWLYGCILGSPLGEYRQIEIKMYDHEPHLDSIEVFLQAPPSLIQKLRQLLWLAELFFYLELKPSGAARVDVFECRPLR